MATERRHFPLPNLHGLPHLGRASLLAIFAGTAVAGGVALQRSGAFDSSGNSDGDNNRLNISVASVLATATQEPTLTPTLIPTLVPTEAPTPIPTATPTQEPTKIPTTVSTRAVVQAQPTVEPTKVPVVDAAKIQREVWAKITNDAIAATNAERVKRGLSSLRVDNRLSIVAQKQIDLVVSRGYPFYYSDAHTGNDQTVRAKREGYPYDVLEVAEYAVLGLSRNIAADFVRSWVYNSPGHSAELLASDNVTIGGYCASKDVKRSDGIVGVAICYIEVGK